MLTIRLSRIGKRNKPMYRLIISEKSRDPYGRALEILGSYNPYTKELCVKADRIKYWVSKGSGMSATVNNLLVEKGVIKSEKMKASKPRKKKKSGENKKDEDKKFDQNSSVESGKDNSEKSANKLQKEEKINYKKDIKEQIANEDNSKKDKVKKEEKSEKTDNKEE